ncbi:FadR/GntR family transcriptional regulator [Sphingopyxis macrogoltabida]|uniref:GntR family transcriptional regulator n=1 Tax=Sphingopyxis macrogoltabida TaxID=33050 RepID=A0A0N9V2I0_SPHMC|nr:FadR/GntR family transcriptional regulator [Sphingopyxis macrogoltabida]ALH82490.1 GntR family transcriptional regulator [Sphingopyxis macrogoltabida]
MAVTKAASLADDLVQRFEEQIETGDMPPGSRFPTEKAITEAFGVSRTVVREAYSRLAARGLLVSRRGSGAYVADGAHYRAFQVTPDETGKIEDVLQLLEMRMGFEAEMAELAARRRTVADLAEIGAALRAMDESTDVDGSVAADTAFHAAIARATGNPYFIRFTQFLGVRLVPSRQLYLQGSDAAQHQRYARTINRDHRAIHAAIEAGDAAAARRAARRHIEKSIARYRTLLEAGAARPPGPDEKFSG